MGCPVGRLPLMPIERNKKLYWTFIALFTIIYVSQVVVVEPKLDVWYFMLTTTLLSFKLILSFFVTSCA